MSRWTDSFVKPVVWIAAGAAIVGGTVVAQNATRQPVTTTRAPLTLSPTGLTDPTPAPMSLRSMDAAFADLAESAAPSVVHITTNLGDLAKGETARAVPGTRAGGEGSGFVYRSDGWIVTNEHVVQGFDRVRVVLADGREMIGKVTTASDPQLDLAVIKLDTNGLKSLPIAESDLVRPGQYAMAIGAPFGLENTVTVGHISAISRTGQINDPMSGQMRGYTGMIQTDASINPGNSGGPLINLDGQLIGVNTSIYSTTGGNNGIGFAIPSKVVRGVADELISKGKFDRGLLGVVPRDLKPYEKADLKIASGAYVSDVPADSAAYKAGLRVKDVITRIGTDAVKNELDLRVAAYGHSPGDTVTVTYLRNGAEKSAQVKLGAPTEAPEAAPQPQQPSDPRGFFSQPFPDSPNLDETPRAATRPRLGVNVQDIDANLRKQFGLPEGANGVVVVAVEDASIASKLNVRAGDIVRSINTKSINSVDDVRSAMSDAKVGSQLGLQFERYQKGTRSEFSAVVPFR